MAFRHTTLRLILPISTLPLSTKAGQLQYAFTALFGKINLIMDDFAVRVYLFGTLTLKRGDVVLPVPRSATARSLLAYLLLYRSRPRPRDVLVGLFWPEYSEARARRALSQAIWTIRSEYPDLLAVTADMVQVASPESLWVDVDEFQRLVTPYLDMDVTENASPDLRRALQLYRGDLLESIYDDWALLERERLRELYLRALEMLIHLEKTAGRYQQALDLSLVLLHKDPLREAAHREAMRLYHLLGRPEAALQQFEKCRRVLQEELAIEPSPETVALVREISSRSGKALPPHLPAVPPPKEPIRLTHPHPIPIALIGRSKERAELLAHVDSVFSGKGGMVLLEGEAGVGKTRLLQEVARDAEWRGAQVLWGSGDEMVATAPYGPLVNALEKGLSALRVAQLRRMVDPLWLQVLKPLLPKLADHLPDLGPLRPLEPARERTRLVEAVVRMLTGWAQVVPLVVILEDLHWMDPDTLDLLVALVPRLGESGALFLCTIRRGEARDDPRVWKKLRELDRAGLLQRFVIDRLDVDATGELIRRTLGLREPAPLFEGRIYRETEGNPLFVLETLRALQDEGLLVRDDDGNWHTPWDETTTDYAELPLTPLVERVISRRLHRLAPDLRRVVNFAAVLGQQVSPSLLQAVTGMTAAELFSALRELVWRHFLQETVEGYDFVHAKIRQVAYSELGPEERVRYHHQVAQALEQESPQQVEALARHYTLAQLWEKAIYYHYRAGLRAVRSSSYPLAREHFSRALAFLDRVDSSPVERFELLAEREKVLDVLGERDAQAKDLDAMQEVARDEPQKLCQVFLRRAWLLARLSQFNEALAAARHALELSEQLDDVKVRAEIFNVMGSTFAWQGKDAEGIPLLRKAVTLSQQAGDPALEARYRRSLASALLGVCEYTDAEQELAAALQQADRSNDLLERVEIYNVLGIIYMQRGDSEKALAAYKKSLEYSRAIGFRFGEGRALVNLGNLYYFLGRLGEMLECYAEGARIFNQLNEKRGEMQVLLNRASVALNVLGSSSQVLADAQRAWDYARESGDLSIGGQALTVLAETARQRGDYKKAREYLMEGIRLMERSGDHWLLMQGYRILALLDIEEGRYEEAMQCLERSISICREQGMADLEPSLLAIRGLALSQRGRHEEALRSTAEAMDRLQSDVEQGYLIPYWRAQVLEAAGKTVEARQAMVMAYELLQQALSGLSPEQRRVSLENIPEHRDIVAAWQKNQPRRVTVILPSADSSRQEVSVAWTVESPEDEAIAGKVARRRHRILRLLREARAQGAVPARRHLAEVLGVGVRTIERDIAALRKEGRLLQDAAGQGE